MTASVKVSSSKSLVNRFLILQAEHSNLNLDWQSDAEDVLNLKQALSNCPAQSIYDLGEGGTTLRFFALYLSSFKGEWILKCKPSLLKRPQDELFTAVKSLGAQLTQIDERCLSLRSDGWQQSEIQISTRTTTQVLTGLVLAALATGAALKVFLDANSLASDYFELTKFFVAELGFKLAADNDSVFIPGRQVVKNELRGWLESDWSSAAFLYVLAALKGSIELEGLSANSSQPDSIIRSFLTSLGARSDSEFGISKGSLPYSGFDINLEKSPDLFPVLSTLACFCVGSSRLYGAPQLRNKETDRITQMSLLLQKCGYELEELEDGLIVKGRGLELQSSKEIRFDVSDDHRMYMATEVLSAMGYKLVINGAESIRKSFPEYEDLKKGVLKCFF